MSLKSYGTKSPMLTKENRTMPNAHASTWLCAGIGNKVVFFENTSKRDNIAKLNAQSPNTSLTNYISK